MTRETQAIFKHITQGVYVISVDNGQQKNAFTAAWVMQVSFDPLLLCFSINSNHYSYQLLQEGNRCCISVLDNKQYPIAHHFGQSTTEDKMKKFKWLKTKTGALALEGSLAYFDCRVDHYSDAGDHKLVICQVVEAITLNEGEPMLYSETKDMDGSSELYND